MYRTGPKFGPSGGHPAGRCFQNDSLIDQHLWSCRARATCAGCTSCPNLHDGCALKTGGGQILVEVKSCPPPFPHTAFTGPAAACGRHPTIHLRPDDWQERRCANAHLQHPATAAARCPVEVAVTAAKHWLRCPRANSPLPLAAQPQRCHTVLFPHPFVLGMPPICRPAVQPDVADRPPGGARGTAVPLCGLTVESPLSGSRSCVGGCCLWHRATAHARSSAAAASMVGACLL